MVEQSVFQPISIVVSQLVGLVLEEDEVLRHQSVGKGMWRIAVLVEA